MRLRYTSFALLLLGAAIEIALSEVSTAAFWDGFEAPNPSLFYRLGWLWGTLRCVLPGLVVGFLAIRNAPWLSGLSYLIGSIGYSVRSVKGCSVVRLFCCSDAPLLIRSIR